MSNPSFTYTPNVPQAAQKISATQEPILNNFQAINDFFVYSPSYGNCFFSLFLYY